MKARFLTLAFALVGLFTLTSSFTPANGQLGTTILGGTDGTGCTFAGGTLVISNFMVSGDNVTATGTITDATGTVLATTPLTLTGATCMSLSFTAPADVFVTGTRIVDPLTGETEACQYNLGDEFTWMSTVDGRKGGGQQNLIYNSLCSIAHLLTTNASPQAILAHVNNLLRRTAKLAM